MAGLSAVVAGLQVLDVPDAVVAALAMPAMPMAAPPMMPAETTERAKVRAMLLIISEFSCVSWLFSFCTGAFRR